MYSWERVAVRTERVYDAVAVSRRDDTFLARLKRFYKCVSSIVQGMTGIYYHVQHQLRNTRTTISLSHAACGASAGCSCAA